MATISYKASYTYQGVTAYCTITVTYSTSSSATATTVTATKIEASTVSASSTTSAARTQAIRTLTTRVQGSTFTLAFNGQTVASRTTTTVPGNSYTFSGSKSVNKTTSTQSKSLVLTLSGALSGSTTQTISVPALASYTISFNANGGSGAPGNQTKYYNTALTLTTTKPSKTGYTFKGWATSTANASIGTVNYASGGTIAAGTNSALTLYAVWELTYSKPTITSVSVERCDANGNSDDEGAYAEVNFDWSVFTSTASRYWGGTGSPYASNTISSASVTVGDVTKAFTASDTMPIIVGDGSFGTDTQYDVSITITDSQSIATSHTTTVTGILTTSSFPIDFNNDGTAMGIFKPAPDNAEGVYLGKDLFLALDTTATSGTDKEIYDALVSLGWDSDVIV